MGHGITENDVMISTEGYSWHRLDRLEKMITKETASPVFNKIIEGKIQINVDGNMVDLPNYKALIADLRGLGMQDQMVPLHVPKEGYKVISNEEIFDAAVEAIKDVDAKITSIMTLENRKKFALSVNLGDDVMKVNGDDIHAHLNFVSSHDGTMNLKAYDSTIRVVCMNTLRWSLEAAGEVGFTIRHTKNAAIALENLPELVNAILAGRINFKEVMTYLASCKVDSNEALAMTAGYFCMESGSPTLSTRSLNSAQSIVDLFANGKGNNGKTLYDLANGATEYWTSGDGVGRNANDIVKSYKAEFGMAADHKNRFVELLANEDRLKEAKTLGKEALAEALKN
jgi:hypothetical protein